MSREQILASRNQILPLAFILVMSSFIMDHEVDAASAKENFDWYCVQCHGPEGAGDGINSEVDELPVGPMALSKSEEMAKFSNDEIVKTLTQGGPANTLESLMPPWGNTFSADEIEELMKHVRSLCQDENCP